MKARYRAKAIADIASIYLYLKKQNAAGSGNVIRSIYEAIGTITAAPNAAERTDDPSIRLKIVPKYRYKIFYSIVEGDTIDILHVRHTARRQWASE